MPFEKGQSGNPSGRPTGANSKVSRELREMISSFLLENFEEVQNCFSNLEPKEKIKVYCDLLVYAVPRLKIASDNPLEGIPDEDLIKLYAKLKGAAVETVKTTISDK